MAAYASALFQWTKSCSSLFAYLECLQNLIVRIMTDLISKFCFKHFVFYKTIFS